MLMSFPFHEDLSFNSFEHNPQVCRSEEKEHEDGVHALLSLWEETMSSENERIDQHPGEPPWDSPSDKSALLNDCLSSSFKESRARNLPSELCLENWWPGKGQGFNNEVLSEDGEQIVDDEGSVWDVDDSLGSEVIVVLKDSQISDSCTLVLF